MMDGRRTVLRNDFNKETIIFTQRTIRMLPASMSFLGTGGSGGGNALVHVHPLTEERFLVTSGQIKVVVDGREQLVGAGEQVVVPRGRPHYFLNGRDGDTEFTVEFRPAQQHLLFFSNFAPDDPNGSRQNATRISPDRRQPSPLPRPTYLAPLS